MAIHDEAKAGPDASNGLFYRDLCTRVERLRAAVGALTESLAQEPILRAVELQRTLDIDNRLAWKVWTVMSETDAFRAAQQVPGPAGQRIVLASAERAGANPLCLRELRDAFDGFEEIVGRHAGDRPTFESMLSAHLGEARGQADLAQRRSAFRPLSYHCGVQARAYLSTFILNASDDPAMFDAATVRGFIKLRWIRPNAPWRLSRMCTVDSTGAVQSAFTREPLEPDPSAAASPFQLPLMRQFCSQPLPTYRLVDSSNSHFPYALAEGEVGNAGAMTCILGEVVRRAAVRYQDEKNPDNGLLVHLRTPCELAIVDLLAHRDLFPGIDPQVELFSDLFADGFNALHQDCDRLPVYEQVERLSAAAGAVRIPEVPRYHEMLDYAFGRLGWKREEFGLFRVRMKYPVVPSSLRLYHGLPKRP